MVCVTNNNNSNHNNNNSLCADLSSNISIIFTIATASTIVMLAEDYEMS